MSSVQAECAPKYTTTAWHSIDWTKCYRYVKRLQIRIAKAVRTGRYNKAKALQWILVRSFAARAIAVRRVTENKGRKTPGVDGIIWSTPLAKSLAISSLTLQGYKPLPLRRVYLLKPNGKKRPLGIPTMKDRAMQALFCLALEPIAETTADPNSYGFRPERCTHDAIQQCYLRLCRKTAPQWVLEADIKGCFDNISHQWLMENIPMNKRILRQWLKAGYMEGTNLFPTKAGTPQGGLCSPIFSNMTLDGLERHILWIRKHFPAQCLHFVRYADDFVILGKSKDFLENTVKPEVADFLAKRGLSLSEEKTKITHIDDGFDFLGQNLRKYQGKLLTRPSRKNYKKFMAKIRSTIKKHNGQSQKALIRNLNPIIRGWANYHSGAAAKRDFAKADHEIWQALWRWAKRRHPNKSLKWIKKRYFIHNGTRDWVFSVQLDEKRRMKLQLASKTPIRRHVKIKKDANPFDPEYELYFEKRFRWKMEKSLKGTQKYKSLWKKQEGFCPVCKRFLIDKDKWEIHHIIRKCEGGSDKLSNLQLLHINCHRQIHNPAFQKAQTGGPQREVRLQEA